LPPPPCDVDSYAYGFKHAPKGPQSSRAW
jgi:hypothetical protein